MEFLEKIKPHLKKDILFYVFFMGLAVSLSFFRNLIFGFALEPEGMGYYSIVITIASYGAFLQIGLMSGLTRELPVSLGQGKKLKGLNLVGETTTAVMFIQSILLVIYFIIIFSISFDDNIMKSAFFLAGLVVIPSQLLSMVMLRLRSEQRKLAFSFLYFITTLSSVGLGYIAVIYFGFKGAVWVFILVNLSAFIIVSAKFLSKVNYFYFDYKEIAYLVKIGFPVMLAGVAISLFITMDKIFLIRYSTVEDLGIYQIALLPMIFGITVQSMVNQITTPKLLFDFGAGSSLSNLYKQVLIISFFVMIFMIFLGPFIVFILSFIIKGWLPLYLEALPLISIFYVTSILIAANLSDIIYVASNKPILMFYQNLALVLLAFMVFIFISSKPVIWYAYAVLILQLLKLLSSLLINFLIVRNSKYT